MFFPALLAYAHEFHPMNLYRLAKTSFAMDTRGMKLVFLLAAFLEVREVHGGSISIGAPEVIYSKSQRKSAGGSNWPDGSIGVVSNGNGTYDFYAANGPKPTLTTGTLTNPGSAARKVTITNVPKKAFDYLAGGPVFEDPYSGARLMIYHAEVHLKSAKNFHSVLGLAISTDPAGQTFRDLGTIIQPNASSGFAEVGGGSFAIVDGHLNIYYRDYMTTGSSSELAVARASMADLMNNSLVGRSTSFTKYYNGSWSESALGGRSSALEIGNPSNNWVSVSRNDYLGQLVMVTSQWSSDGGDLYYATSSDGVNWGSRQPIALDAGEQYYPTIIGTGADPTHSDQSFYVYYTDSDKGGFKRWGDAQLLRRQVTVNSPLANSSSVSNSLGYTAEWTTIGDYRDDFQTGTPAQGWRYAWDPKGKLGKSAAYAPLYWSNSAQAYNTTGSLTTAPGSKTHHDDFLSLTAFGGHPGQSKYLPMVGYTIQQADGAGFYQLTDSSIQKANSSLLTKEDGLQVLIYVNDTFISSQSVLANGALTGFDRNLGALSVGDTIWVMIDPLKTQIDDAFVNFDFSLRKLMYRAEQLSMMAFGAQLVQSAAVPEPSTMILGGLAFAALFSRRRR
jgi:hypothetical protein